MAVQTRVKPAKNDASKNEKHASLSRDTLILIVAVVILLISGYRPFPPSIFGKLTTFFEITLVFTVVLTAAYPAFHSRLLHNALDDIVTVFAIGSAVHYSFLITRHAPAT